MDEVGSSIPHSDDPNTQVFPFIFSPDNTQDDPKTLTYSLLWPSKSIKKDEYYYRDYLQGVTEESWRSARFFPWFNIYEEYFLEEYEKFK